MLHNLDNESTPVPYHTSMVEALRVSAPALAIHWQVQTAVQEQSSLPRPIVAMVLYAVAVSIDCEYGRASLEQECGILGLDESTLSTIRHNPLGLEPRRVGAVIAFARKVAHSPAGLSPDDLHSLRRQGVNKAEIVEVIQLVALGRYLNVLAEALQIPVDPGFLMSHVA